MEKISNIIYFDSVGNIYLVRIFFIVSSILLIFSTYIFFKSKINKLLNYLIPQYHSINIESNDPYLKSILDGNNIQKDIDKIKKSILKFIFFVFFIVSFSLVFSLIFSDSTTFEISSNKVNVIQFGPFGDLFNGILAPLLTFSSFVFLLLTVIMQNVQMRATLNELQNSRVEMRNSTSALESQVKNLNLQKFDNIFFSLVDNYKTLIKELREQNFQDHDENIIKDSYDSYVVKKFRRINIKESLHELKFFWDESKDVFSSIFLMNYQILKYIDENVGSVISAIEAKRYIGILRAVTPKEIIFIIYVNGGVVRRVKYRRLLEKYAFLEHILFENLDIEKFKLISKNYNVNAFGDCELLKTYFSRKKIDYLIPHPAFDGIKYFIENIKISKSPLSKKDKEFLNKMISDELYELRLNYEKIICMDQYKSISEFIVSDGNFINFCKDKIIINSENNAEINHQAKLVKARINAEYKRRVKS